MLAANSVGGRPDRVAMRQGVAATEKAERRVQFRTGKSRGFWWAVVLKYYYRGTG